MNTRILHFLFVVSLVLCVPGMLSCVDSLGGRDVPVQIKSVMLGYVTEEVDLSSTGLVDSRKVDGGYYVMFASAGMIAESAGRTGWDQVTSHAGRIVISDDEFRLLMKTTPENAMVDELEVTSSNPAVVSVLRVEGKEVVIRTSKLGETNLHVRVKGSMNTVEEDFPVRVVSEMEVEFYVTPFWEGSVNTRLHFRPRKLPKGYLSFVSKIQDSVTVCGYCEWYDFRYYGSKKKVTRDTIRLPMQETYTLFCPDIKVFFRNATSAVREFRQERAMTGSRIVVNGDGTRDTVVHRYYFTVEQLILDFNVISDEPFYEYHFHTQVTETTDVIVEDSDEIGDSGTDGNVGYDPHNNGRELRTEEKNRFVIRYNDFLSDEERARQSEGLRSLLGSLGYDDSMSDEEKQAIIDEANAKAKQQ